MSISSLSLDLKSSPQSRCSGTAAASADTAAQTKTNNPRKNGFDIAQELSRENKLIAQVTYLHGSTKNVHCSFRMRAPQIMNHMNQSHACERGGHNIVIIPISLRKCW